MLRLAPFAGIALAFVPACGARTPLEVQGAEAPPPATSLPDAGIDTFPCRWSYGPATELETAAEAPTGLGGGVHDTIDLAHLFVDRPSGGRSFIYSFAGRAIDGSIRDVALEAGVKSVGRPAGFLALDRDRCDARGRNFDGDDDGFRTSPGAGQCSYGVPARGRVPLTRRRGGEATLLSYAQGADRFDVIGDLVPPTGGALRYPVLDRFAAGLGWVVELAGTDTLYELREGRRARTLPLTERTIGAAADSLRGGLVLLQVEGSTFTLRYWAPGASGPAALAFLDELPAAPIATDAPRRLVTNETEALFLLEDGAVAYQPLSGTALRWTDPLPEEGLDRAVLMLRPGQSIGGVLYTFFDGGRMAFVVAFRPLICNR